MASRHYLIVGCGYLGQRVADLLLSRGDKVSALTRSAETADAFRAMGIDPIVGDIMEPSSLTFPDIDELIYAVGFDRSEGHSKRSVYVDGLAGVLQMLPDCQRVTYVSSTSVYGQCDGEWVDQHSHCVPTTESGRICLDAEETLRARVPDAAVIRLAGIYGPNRLLRRVESLVANEPIAGNPDAFLNLIHVDDAARLVADVAAATRRREPYLGADGNPPKRREFYEELARLVGAPSPIFDANLPSRSSAAGLGKRCRAVVPEGFELQYPSMRQGLPHAVSATEAQKPG